MPVNIVVKAQDELVRAKRQTAAESVINEFGDKLPEQVLLAFLDDEDWGPFLREFGQANRGLSAPIKTRSFEWPTWPGYVTGCVFVDDPPALVPKRVFDHVVYVSGSTCADEVGL